MFLCRSSLCCTWMLSTHEMLLLLFPLLQLLPITVKLPLNGQLQRSCLCVFRLVGWLVVYTTINISYSLTYYSSSSYFSLNTAPLRPHPSYPEACSVLSVQLNYHLHFISTIVCRPPFQEQRHTLAFAVGFTSPYRNIQMLLIFTLLEGMSYHTLPTQQ